MKQKKHNQKEFGPSSIANEKVATTCFLSISLGQWELLPWIFSIFSELLPWIFSIFGKLLPWIISFFIPLQP